MAKKSNKNSFLRFFLQKLTEEEFKPLLGWFLIILASFLILVIFSPKALLTSKINHFLEILLGWNKFITPLFFFVLGIFLLFKPAWFKFLKIFLGLLLNFLILNFYFHFLFREGGYLGDLILFLVPYLGLYGLIFLSFVFFFLALWLIFEEKFFEMVKNFYQVSKEKILEKETKRLMFQKVKEAPFKQVKKEITGTEKQLTSKIKLKVRKVLPKSVWNLPPLDLLVQAKEEVIAPDLKSTSQIIQKTLENFGIKVEIVDVEIGPAITRFSLKPGEGVKLSKILSYQSDLALALGVPNLIIETPIPGKAVLGLQIPNLKPAQVRLGNVLREKEFLESESLLLFPVGRKINGEVLFADLAKMPHLLIAGATGTGKSIFIHNLLISFLMKNTPETLNFILIDPKRVELINYAEIPHLLLDPVIEVKKTLAVFNWIIEEMEERYKILQETGSRDIDTYNHKQIQRKEKIMPRIVLVIDEMADLMVTYSSNIEAMIIRLAQMARATGIHLVLATQRPSVDIVTGLIKANIPNRICFKVASYVDSRTVLDTGGAEKLIGAGDGLFMSVNLPRPVRVKAPYVSEPEIKKVVDFWKEQIEKVPEFEKQTIPLEEIEKKVISLKEEPEEEELFKQAVEIVLEAGKASTSLLQRRLKIGYARAARILDLMEEKGIVGPQEGSKPRKVLITKEDLENYLVLKSYKSGTAKQTEE